MLPVSLPNVLTQLEKTIPIRNMSRQRIGVWFIGAFGGVGTTATAGLFALQKGLAGTAGLVSEQPRFADLALGLYDVVLALPPTVQPIASRTASSSLRVSNGL